MAERSIFNCFRKDNRKGGPDVGGGGAGGMLMRTSPRGVGRSQGWGAGQEGASQHLKDDFLVYSELGNDVRQQQVATVFAGRVHAGLGEQARPREGHEAAQLAVAVLVVVVDVVRGVLHQQRGELQEVNPQGVQHVRLLLGVQHLRGTQGKNSLLALNTATYEGFYNKLMLLQHAQARTPRKHTRAHTNTLYVHI